MTTPITTREFIRNFSRLRKSAANGDEIIIRDRGGKTFVFRAQAGGPTLGDQLRDLCGTLTSGKLVKTLAGFGRKRHEAGR